jgi:hypothetical protein
MLSDAELDSAFLSCGYRKTGKLQYKAVFSNDEVHHYVEMQRSIRDRSYLPGRVRVGNEKIAILCEEIWFTYKNRPIELPLHNSDFDSICQIFWNIDRERKYTSAGALLADEAENVSSFLNELVTPLMRPISTLEKLYNVTLHPEGTPFQWQTGEPGVKATQALVLARELDITFSEIVSELEGKRHLIEEWSEIKDMDVFFKFVWENIDESRLPKS